MNGVKMNGEWGKNAVIFDIDKSLLMQTDNRKKISQLVAKDQWMNYMILQ